MTEVLFYHLQGQPLDRVLPTLLERSLARGWRVVVQASARERVEALDGLLWTYADDSFLPHGTDKEPDPHAHPIIVTDGPSRPNEANVRFLVDGSPLPADIGDYERVVVLFDGNDPDAVDSAREQWRLAKSAGHACTYWKQSEAGRWEKQA